MRPRINGSDSGAWRCIVSCLWLADSWAGGVYSGCLGDCINAGKKQMPPVGTLLARAEGPDPMSSSGTCRWRGAASPLGRRLLLAPPRLPFTSVPWASGGPSEGLAECVPRSRRKGAAASSRFSQSRTHRPLTLVLSWALPGITRFLGFSSSQALSLFSGCVCVSAKGIKGTRHAPCRDAVKTSGDQVRGRGVVFPSKSEFTTPMAVRGRSRLLWAPKEPDLPVPGLRGDSGL